MDKLFDRIVQQEGTIDSILIVLPWLCGESCLRVVSIEIDNCLLKYVIMLPTHSSWNV